MKQIYLSSLQEKEYIPIHSRIFNIILSKYFISELPDMFVLFKFKERYIFEHASEKTEP
jgi:hypothetical protein